MEASEVSSTPTQEWINDWDLLSQRFQWEAAGYLQVVGVFVAALLFMKRGRVLKGLASLRRGPAVDPPSVSDLQGHEAKP